ncbi:MAG: hypothetical protein MR356_05200 [Agathobacter sp.]|nr:hypothetical protein [Agathobacter sp.]
MVFLVAICLTLVPVQVKAATTDNITSVVPEVKDGTVKVTGTTGADVVAVLVEIFDKDNNLLTMETHKAAGGKYEATIDAKLTEGATYLFYVTNFNGEGEPASAEYQVPKKVQAVPDTKPDTKPDTGTDTKPDTGTDTKPESKPTLSAGTVITSGSDSNTSLKDSKGVLPVNTKLDSKKVTEQKVIEKVTELVKNTIKSSDTIKKEFKELVVYELNLLDGTTELHQLADKVEVTIAVPFQLSANEDILVYRVDGEKLVLCTSKISDGKLTFETDHFSTYVFVKVQAPAAAAPTPTGDRAPILQLVLVLLVGLVIVGTTVICYRKRGKKS